MKTQNIYHAISKLTVLIPLISFASGLVGCAPATPESTPIPPTATLAPPTATPPPTLPPTETPIPTATETPFIPKATIKIVSHFPLTGGFSNYGTDLMHAAEMAVEELAGPLQELGYKLELVPYDDQDSVDIAIANTGEIIADPEILCGVGHFTSRIMIQASEVYHKAGLPFISPSNTSSTVTDRGYLEVNRVIGRVDGQGLAGAQFAKAQGLTTVYIINTSWDPGRISADYFKREANRIGLKVVGTLTTDITEKFEGVVSRMMSTDPDMVFYAGNADQAGPFFREARVAGYSGIFLTIDDNPALVEFSGPLAIDGGLYYTHTAAPANYYPDAGQFDNDFDIRFGATPQLYAAQAYDAAGICIKAIEEATKAKNGEIPTRAEVANAIRALVDYKGITGTYNFNKKGDPTMANYFIYKVISVDPGKWDQNTIVEAFAVEPPR